MGETHLFLASSLLLLQLGHPSSPDFLEFFVCHCCYLEEIKYNKEKLYGFQYEFKNFTRWNFFILMSSTASNESYS